MHPTSGSGCVQLAGRTVQLAWLREHTPQAAPLFARARAEVGHAWCLCRSPAPRLVIRCTRAGRYHLAGWPGEGDQHETTCPFHKLGPGHSGRDRYSTHAIKEADDGVFIRLATPLARNLNRPAHENAADEPPGDRHARRTIGLLGLLHWLWEEAHLNTWQPGFRHRTWHHCHALLRRPLQEVTVNGQGLDSVLYLVPPFTSQAAAANTAALEAFRTRLGRHGPAERRGLLLGQIKEVAPTPYGVAYRLAHQRTPLYARAALHARAVRSFRHAFSQTAAEHGARIALFVVERSPGGYLVAADLAAMLTTRTYIPADSSYEVVMADTLTACRRAFIKPLRYDSADAVLPDFVLTDMTPAAYVEVYGIHGRESYERRKAEKRAFYHRYRARLFEWDITCPLPDLTLPERR